MHEQSRTAWFHLFSANFYITSLVIAMYKLSVWINVGWMKIMSAVQLFNWRAQGPVWRQADANALIFKVDLIPLDSAGNSIVDLMSSTIWTRGVLIDKELFQIQSGVLEWAFGTLLLQLIIFTALANYMFCKKLNTFEISSIFCSTKGIISWIPFCGKVFSMHFRLASKAAWVQSGQAYPPRQGKPSGSGIHRCSSTIRFV